MQRDATDENQRWNSKTSINFFSKDMIGATDGTHFRFADQETTRGIYTHE